MSPRRTPLSARPWQRTVAAFLGAALVAAAWGSVAQTQVTMNALVALGVVMTMDHPGISLARDTMWGWAWRCQACWDS